MVSKLVGTIALGMFVLAGSTAYAGVDPANLCREKKAKAAGKKAFDLLKAFGKNQKKPNTSKLAQDISKAQSKFAKSFSKAEDAWACQTTDDAYAIEVKVDAFVMEQMTRPGSCAECGDGIPAPSVVGYWTVDFDWMCNGRDGLEGMTFHTNGTFTIEGGGGAWEQDDCAVDWWFPNGTWYWGCLYSGGNDMAGWMISYYGLTGCWTAHRSSSLAEETVEAAGLDSSGERMAW